MAGNHFVKDGAKEKDIAARIAFRHAGRGFESRIFDRPLFDDPLLSGLVVGTAESAGLPALMAVTGRDSKRGLLFGPTGPAQVGGAPAEQPLFPPLRNIDDAARIWQRSEELSRVKLPAA